MLLRIYEEIQVPGEPPFGIIGFQFDKKDAPGTVVKGPYTKYEFIKILFKALWAVLTRG